MVRYAGRSAFAALFLLQSAASGRLPPNESRLLDVAGWTGTFNLKTADSKSYDLAGVLWTFNYDRTALTTLNLKWNPLARGWQGTVSGTVNINDKVIVQNGDCTETITYTGSGAADTDAVLGGPLPALLSLDGHSDAFSVTFAASSIAIDMHAVLQCPDKTLDFPPEKRVRSWNPLHAESGLPIPDTGYDLQGTTTLMLPIGAVGDPEDPKAHTITWDLRPTAVKRLEVIVEPEGYDSWRPQAQGDEQTVGNTISIRARLQYTDGSAPDTQDKMGQFIFELIDTSHEPGIAMNVPLLAKAKTTADLQFIPANQPSSPAIGIVDAEGQRAQSDSDSLTQASAVVSSFDWGGWSRLKVTALMPDGRQIMGHLQGDAAGTEILLPKRERTSRIATAWKESVGVSAPDDDESEVDPVGLPDCKGDGLTLYEEYRGFYEGGKHIEGNPKKKDFFILNLIGADAEPGIWLFTDATGLEVHSHLTQDEFFFVDRLINGNHGNGAHLGDQHGVFLVTNEGTDGAAAEFFENGAGRPGRTKGILVQPRNKWGTLAKPYALGSVDQPLTYDVAIAHELLHSIGAEHHGEVDRSDLFTFVYPEFPNTLDGRPLFRVADTRRVYLINEATKADLAEETLARFLKLRDALRNAWAQYGKILGLADADFDEFLRQMVTQEWMIGEPHGQHSGSDQCLMRYFMARVYPITGAENHYYYVPPGTEPLGVQICDSGSGTGVNEAGRAPQSRYFEAAPGRGDDRSKLCVNDSVP